MYVKRIYKENTWVCIAALLIAEDGIWTQTIPRTHTLSEAPCDWCTVSILSTLNLLPFRVGCWWKESIKKNKLIWQCCSCCHHRSINHPTHVTYNKNMLLYWNVPNHSMMNAWKMLAMASQAIMNWASASISSLLSDSKYISL